MRDKLVPALLWGLATLFVVGLVHLASMLMLPRLATTDAFARLPAAAPGVPVAVPPRIEPNGIPFRDTAVASAICRYDLSAGPLRVTAGVIDGNFTAVSFHGRFGVPFYALTGSSAVEGRIEVVLVTAAQLARLEAEDAEDQPVRDVRVTSPGDEGFVEFDVLPRVGGMETAQRALRSVRCKVEGRL